MSGTSMDGIDASLVDFSTTKPKLVASLYQPFPETIVSRIRKLSNPANLISLEQLGQLDNQLGYLYAQAVISLLKKASFPVAQDIMAIGCHGQTIHHAPTINHAFSLQIGDPNIITEETGITTITDFRRRDIALGGQGAPLVPAFHKAFFSDPEENRVILNIGGIANITLLPKIENEKVSGFDTGPGNTLMDYWIQTCLNRPYDKNGNWADSGICQDELLKKMLNDPYFLIAPPKSTGKEYFSPEWLADKIGEKQYLPKDIQATLCHLTTRSISEAIKKLPITPDRLLVCGGGIHNQSLMKLLRKKISSPVNSTLDFGLNPDQVEAVAFAWLARQTINGLPGNITDVTGANRPAILGGIYPGRFNPFLNKSKSGC
jgi:anhydro-N-acetylmuramic acid kinase